MPTQGGKLMNIQIQLCGLFILLLLFVFYKSHNTLQLYSEKVFFVTMCVAVSNLVFDVLSIVFIHFRHIFPEIIVDSVCKIYIASLIWVSMFALIYVLTDLFSEKMHIKRTLQLVVVLAVESLIVFLLPIHIYVDGKVVYTYGPSVLLVYICALINICAVIFVICAFRKRMNRRRACAVALWMLIWMGAAIVQFFNSQLLIVGFASSVGILILFVIMENPEANVDRRLGCFNAHALSEYVKRMFEQKQEFDVLEVSFGNTSVLEGHGLQVHDAIREVLKLISKQTEGLVFKNINSDIVVVSKNANELYDIGSDVLNIIHKYDIFQENAKVIYIPKGHCFDDTEDIFEFMSFMQSEHISDNERVYVVGNEIISKYKQHYVIEQKIKEALEEDRVEVFLQPIYSNEEKRFTSAEALARIRETDGSLLPPGVFIPVAEASGQILELGERVFEKVCDFLKNTEAVKYGIHYIEVNLSIIQCEQKDLAERLIAIVEKYDIDPKLINLEITETASISARTTLLENMKKLIDYGFTFSLDDFGKGESNLMYVVEMPVSLVKLDYDMSKAFFSNSKAKHVVRAVVGMAHGMDLKLVAEGIETKEESDGMNAEGIDYIQGYYYAKPLPMKEFLEYLKNSD